MESPVLHVISKIADSSAQGDNMKFGKLLILAFAAAFCLTLSANAQLGVGGAVKGTTGAVGNVGGQTGAVKGTLDSTTHSAETCKTARTAT